MRMWIAPLKVKKDGNGLKLLAPNKFMKDEVEKNFLEAITKALANIADGLLISLDVNSAVKEKERVRTTPSNYKSN